MKMLLILLLVGILWSTIGFFVARWTFLLDAKGKEKEIVGEELGGFILLAAVWPLTLFFVAAEWYKQQEEKKRVWFTFKK